MAKYRAVIFDMDGVLADSEPVYYAAMQEVLRPLGHDVTEVDQRELMGRSVEHTWQYLAAWFHLDAHLGELAQAYDAELIRRLSQIHDALPGVRDLVAALQSRNVPTAVASSSLPAWIEALLGGLALEEAFHVSVSASVVANPKPAPDIYLEAARRLDTDPLACIAIEDTPTGLASARAAGMLTVQVRAASTAFPPLEDAAIVIDSLHDFDLALLARRLDQPGSQ